MNLHLRPWRQIRSGISPALLIIGILLLGYVGVQYGEMYLEQRHLAQEWQQQQLSNPNAPGSANSTAANVGLTRLSVPKIDLDSVITEGINHKSLLLGPAHMPDTPKPGDVGNSVIAGHRDTFFRHIHELDRGDTVLVQRDGKTITYEVTGKEIVEPTDLAVLKPAHDRRLTLITCYPTYYIGPAPKRLVVFARAVAPKSANDTPPRAVAHGAGQ